MTIGRAVQSVAGGALPVMGRVGEGGKGRAHEAMGIGG
jgi:hypothetical protein